MSDWESKKANKLKSVKNSAGDDGMKVQMKSELDRA